MGMQNSGRVARFILFERSEFPILASRPTTQDPPVQFFPKGFFSKLSHEKIGNDS